MSDESVLYSATPNQRSNELVKSSAHIRKACAEDAVPLMALMNELVKDGTAYLTDKLAYTIQHQVEYINASGKDSIVLVAESNDELVGWINLRRNHFQFRHHTGTLVMGVKKELQHQGIGVQLLDTLKPLALFIGIERLELDVRTENPRAHTFYRKYGFVEEGRKIRAIKRNGQYSDEVFMAKWIR